MVESAPPYETPARTPQQTVVQLSACSPLVTNKHSLPRFFLYQFFGQSSVQARRYTGTGCGEALGGSLDLNPFSRKNAFTE